MIYGNYIINAEQAQAMTKQALKEQSRDDSALIEAQMEADLKKVNLQIQNAAKNGEGSIRCWIMYQSTYEALVSHGYRVYGGVLMEAIPPRLVNSWGKENEKFNVVWEQNIGALTLDDVDVTKLVHPNLRSPNTDVVLPRTQEETEPQDTVNSAEDTGSEAAEQKEPVLIVRSISYKLAGDGTDLFGPDSIYEKARVLEGYYPESYAVGETVDISSLRYYFYEKGGVLYRFRGWYLDKDKTKRFIAPIEGDLGDVVLYADISIADNKM